MMPDATPVASWRGGIFPSRKVAGARLHRYAEPRLQVEKAEPMKTVSTSKSHGGVQGVYAHASETCACDMTFAVYVPPQAKDGPVPVLWYLSGLTCTHAN
ncbi:alpha/beta hydrolase-fold protein, partial [Aminobacter sp. Piv2-1]|uniref:alpha/beta hydrolase-fold protein n=1 Tax=Aminobacter sp. Piv2-1 TaxID=3031122 RepID=UPI0030B5E5EA